MQELSGLDARFLYSETAAAHMHTIKMAVVDPSGRADLLTPELVHHLIAVRLDRMPALRRRVVTVPWGLTHPMWLDDPEFDLDRHLVFRTADAPGGRRELAAIVAEVASLPLPRDRPLWELTVVDGLEGGEVAFVVKLHHAVADGMASVAMLMNAFQIDAAAAISEPYRPEPLPRRRDLLSLAWVRIRRGVRGIPDVLRRTGSGVSGARRARKEEVARILGPFAGPRTAVNVALVPDRTFAMTGLAMEDVVKVKRSLGVTVNDVFLGICGGALQGYLTDLGEPPATSLTASVPVATRTDVKRLSGNHVDNLFLPLHTEVADPCERLALIHESVQAARRVRAELGVELFEDRAEFTPPRPYAGMMRLWSASGLSDHVRPPINLIASNVPGPREPLTLEGGRVTALYSVGPILEGIGLNITAWSYLGSLFVSVLGCSKSLPDPWELISRLELELEGLVVRAGVDPPHGA